MIAQPAPAPEEPPCPHDWEPLWHWSDPPAWQRCCLCKLEEEIE